MDLVAAPADLVAVRLARAAAVAHRVWAAAAWEAVAGAAVAVAAVAVAAVVDAAVVAAADAAGKRGVKGEQR